MAANSGDKLNGSIEGSLREPQRPPGGDLALPADQAALEAAPARAGDTPAQNAESPVVLYGRLGYVRRDLTNLDGAIHHNPPPGV